MLYSTHCYVKDIPIREKLFYVCELMNVQGLYFNLYYIYK